MPMSKESKVVAMTTGVPKEAPPVVDLATMIRLLPVAGQKAKTSPAPLVLTSPPIAVPTVSAPLTWIGVCQAPAGPDPGQRRRDRGDGDRRPRQDQRRNRKSTPLNSTP